MDYRSMAIALIAPPLPLDSSALTPFSIQPNFVISTGLGRQQVSVASQTYLLILYLDSSDGAGGAMTLQLPEHRHKLPASNHMF